MRCCKVAGWLLGERKRKSMCNAPNCVNWDVAGAMELFCKLLLVALLKQKTEPHTKKREQQSREYPNAMLVLRVKRVIYQQFLSDRPLFLSLSPSHLSLSLIFSNVDPTFDYTKQQSAQLQNTHFVSKVHLSVVSQPC